MRFAIVVFPGTWSDYDCQYALGHVLGQRAELVWHRERDLTGYDCVVLPGGFSYGVGSSRVDLQACKLEYSIVSPK